MKEIYFLHFLRFLQDIHDFKKFFPCAITIRVSDLDGALIKRYAHFNNETVSTLLKRLIMDQIEDDYRKLVARLEEVDSS